MELRHGNERVHPRDRGARERAGDADRALDWAVRASDILLFPHSPLALADVLAHPAGRLDLVPADAEGGASAPETPSAEATVLPPSPRHADDASELRAALRTRHGDEALAERCRKLLIENALLAHRGERQLCLAVGFVRWSDAADAPPRRAPLLLYPALLVRRPGEGGYELRLDGSQPLENAVLAAALRESHDVSLPAMEAARPLREHLARVATLLADATPLTLELDIALGSAELSFATAPPPLLPPLPHGLDTALALELVDALDPSALGAMLSLLPDYDAIAARGATGSAPAAGDDDGDVGRLHDYAEHLLAEGLGDIELRHVETLPDSIARWSAQLDAGLATRTVAMLESETGVSARQLARLAGTIELLDRAPDAIERYAHPDLAYGTTRGVLRRARHQARMIEDELEALKDHFLLDKVPAKPKLLSLIEELGGTIDFDEPVVVDADYFGARRQFMEFSIEKPASLAPEHRRRLGQLAKVLRFRELFVNNTEYRAALGPGYRGLRTDWETLGGVAEHAAELAETLGSEALAARALGRWGAFRETFTAELETLQQAAGSARRLLRVCGRTWGERPAAELVGQAKALGERLERWRETRGTLGEHGTRTAAMLLAPLAAAGGEPRALERAAMIARARVDARIAAGTTTALRAAATVEWLRAASATAVGAGLDREAIVARLGGGAT